MNKLSLLTLLILSCLFQACNMINPKESLPTYIQIDSVRVLSTLPNIHGSVSQKVTDVWVYYNRQLLGAFPLPAKVPVLADDQGELEVIAGIWDNGLSGTRAKYPFYNLDTFTFKASPTGIIHHTPIFSYRTADSAQTAYFVEDFEQGNSFERLYGDTTFVKTNDPGDVFEGNFSARMELTDSARIGQSITVQSFSLPSTRMCYLELNYTSEVPFVLQTEVNQGGTITKPDIIGVNPSSKWNKIYINFGNYVATYPGAGFKFVFGATLPTGMTHGKILIDNFKIIHFK